MKNFKFTINDHSYSVNILDVEQNMATVDVNGVLYEVKVEQELKPVKTMPHRKDFVPLADTLPSVKTYKSAGGTGIMRSPLPGKIVDVVVKAGDKVSVGQSVVCLEAMKMENNIRADREGTVKVVKVQTNDVVVEGDVLLEIE